MDPLAEQLPCAPTDAVKAHAAMMAERRHGPRSSVIKSAKLVFGDRSVFDCLVLDESSGGVLIDLGTIVKVPEEMTIQFSSGVSFLAQRCWNVGTKAGLSFNGVQIVTQQTAERMQALAGILELHGLGPAIKTLRAARFFDNLALREAAEDVEAAYARFEAVLNGRGAGSSPGGPAG